MTNTTRTGYYRCTAYMCQVPTYGSLCHKCGGEADFVKYQPCAYCNAECDEDGQTHTMDCPCHVPEVANVSVSAN